MNDAKICVPVCGRNVEEVLAKLDRASEVADIIEIRFDSVDPSEIEPLLSQLGAREEQFLFTFRPREQGGFREITREERIEFWLNVAPRFGDADNVLVDIEYDLDDAFGFCEEQVIVSRHDFGQLRGDLSDVYDELLSFPSGARKFAATVDDASDAVSVWKLFNESGLPAIPIAMGEAGKWTRILGPAYFAFVTYASLDPADATAPGQITAADLRDVFRVKDHTPRTHIYALLAGDTSYSLSPYMHNAAFAESALDCVFIPMQVRDLDAFMRRMVNGATREVELHFKGFSVTNPHKQSVMSFLDQIDDVARQIGAVNTVKIENGKRLGFNTDASGFIEPLRREFADLKGARVAIVGAGGAARACVYAMREEGSEVTILGRDMKKSTALADEFGVRVEPLESNRPLAADIFVNATPVGTRGEFESATIARAEELRDVKLVYDLVYNPKETALLREAKTAGVKTLGGLEMLIAQGAAQFRIWTGREAPVAVMKTSVEERLK